MSRAFCKDVYGKYMSNKSPNQKTESCIPDYNIYYSLL